MPHLATKQREGESGKSLAKVHSAETESKPDRDPGKGGGKHAKGAEGWLGLGGPSSWCSGDGQGIAKIPMCMWTG